MSFDLGVFYTARSHTDAEAVRRYVAYCDEDDLSPYVEPSPAVAAFLQELTAELPQIDDWPEESIDDCPWSCAFDVSEGQVEGLVGMARVYQRRKVSPKSRNP